MQTLGQRIKLIEKDSGLGQEGFAKALGISVQGLINYEKDRRSPPSSLFLNICRQFKVNPNWLLMGEGEAFPKTESALKTEEAKTSFLDPAVIILNECEKEVGKSLSENQREVALFFIRTTLEAERNAVKSLINKIVDE